MRIPSGDEVSLLEALHQIGPISAAMDAGLRTFQVYQLTQIDVLVLINFSVL